MGCPPIIRISFSTIAVIILNIPFVANLHALLLENRINRR
jgi:hypothetical protein